MYTDLTNLCIGPESTIHQAIAKMEFSPKGIVLAVDPDGRLLSTITDGDVRRAVLANIKLEETVSVLIDRKARSPQAHPITAPVDSDSNTLSGLLKQHSISHLPLVNSENRVVALVTWDEFMPDEGASLQAVIMAGGSGTRLRPLTEELPKPMLPMGDRPLMEIIVQQLQEAGVKQVNVAVHHKHQKIIEHFGDGREFGVELTYVTEDRPLGTAGSLGLMESPTQTVLVINGDILTQVDFRAMLAYHREHAADLTVAVQWYDLQVPYGVVECEGALVRRLSEKPSFKFLVNAGIYLLEPGVYGFIPDGEPYDMTDLIQRLVDEGLQVVAFPIREYWIDIGEHEDYESAQEQLKNWIPGPANGN